ncbi:hypothetical protein DSO57_1023036 [Entomophthora muscae]|uniref:Uncharacterized protein n=2 Tax=Entomophthora muscae TaxID=34485 RepID=A0ACC2UNN3_9FUNG|nr:hypothetical protein DSO57_1021926 [Entomophthora muscae]KAJ9088443.1 hypothetical protein DSO57_1023036 [Entomophthora muscae]
MAPEYSIPNLEQKFKTLVPTGVIHVVGRMAPMPAASVKKLYSRYPVKLLCPQMVTNPISKTCYMMGYGGGIVQGDVTILDAAVTGGANLTLLTQGSTKVFKNPLRHPSAQASNVTIGAGSSCLFLPDPVVCYNDAIYHQHQTFDLEDSTSSLVLLDWYSSGRKESGEVWALRSYFSKISIRIGGVLKARDITTLTQTGEVPLAERMGEHSTFATIFLVGPRFQDLAASLLKEFEHFKVDPSLYRKDLMWFVAPLDEVPGGIIMRVAARDTDALRIFFRLRFTPLTKYVDPERMFF